MAHLKSMAGTAAIIAAAGIGAGMAVRALTRNRNGHFTGRTVLITGGSRGLGLALARQFAKEGCRIALCARDAGELDAARRDLASRGADVFAVQCDVGDRAQVARMMERVLHHVRRVDVLVNNAGEILVGPVESMTLEDFERAMQVMFWGTVYPTLALLPHMQRQESRIVNITSIAGKVAVPHLLPYTCAKFAAVGFSEGLRAEMAGKGVKVVTIAPGLMRTGSHLNAEFKGDQDKEPAWFSLGATLPGLSTGAERAAREIVEATRRGQAEKILTAPANMLARFHGVSPGLAADLLGAIGRLVLPAATRNGKRSRRGHNTRALDSPWLSAVTVLGRIAARRLLQPRKA
jgi:NAD(P)-dependent dehydrogenase (short-subunit alcohol dehydrogenase family)